jgi:predicted Zn-dependent protease
MGAQERRKLLEEMLAETPEDAELRYAIAMEDLSAGETDAALKRFSELTSGAGDRPYVPAFLMAAQTLQKLGRTGEAITVLRAGVEAAQKQNNQHAQGEMQGLLDSLE